MVSSEGVLIVEELFVLLPLKLLVAEMDSGNGGSGCTQLGVVKKLVRTIYRCWRLCMEAYLQGQDL